MKYMMFTVIFALASIAALTQTQTSGPASQDQSGSQKVIKDPSEYNAYVAALGIKDPAQKAAAMEAFVKQYPQTIMLAEALEEAMAGYEKAGNSDKVEEMAKRILQVTPSQINALAVLVALDRNKVNGGDQAPVKEMCAGTQTGLQQLPNWQKPDGMADSDYASAKKQMTDIFNGASGFCTLQNKDYVNARSFYKKALQIEPNSFPDAYQLAYADLEMNPIEVDGLWYCAKAISLAQKAGNADVVKNIAPYCKYRYHKYHGADDGWDQVIASASQDFIPTGFAKSIKPAPTPCELAVQVVQQNDISALSFGDKEFILSKANCPPEQRGTPENKAVADKVWQSIQEMQKGGEARLKIPEVKIISADKNSIDAAITDDNKAANKADVHVVMEKPLLRPPATGTITDITGVITKYTPDPFMFTMEQGSVPGKTSSAPRRPARPAVAQKPAA